MAQTPEIEPLPNPSGERGTIAPGSLTMTRPSGLLPALWAYLGATDELPTMSSDDIGAPPSMFTYDPDGSVPWDGEY